MGAQAVIAAALPQYLIGDRLGSGGAGEVYAAHHRGLDRNVAVKLLPPSLAGDEILRARFQREARLLATLDHPHVIPIYDYVSDGGVSVLIMERLDGGTVASHDRGGARSPERSCAIALAVLSGLHAAHGAGVLHLDIKPSNLLFTAKGTLKVADFGIARVLRDGTALATQSGQAIGTPAYIAPEQATGGRLTPATDVYAAATVLYELLAGHRPYPDTNDAMALVYQHVYEDPRPLGAPVAPELAGVVMRGLAREPAARFPDAEEFAVALAAAAARVLGAGWLERAGGPVQLSARVMAAATTATAGLAVAAPPTGAGQPASPTAVIDELGTLPVPAESFLPPPRPAASPLRYALLVPVCVATIAALALLQPASVSRPTTLELTVAGAPATGPVQLDLTRPVRLTGRTGAVGPVTPRLRLSLAGVPLGQTTAGAPVSPAGGRWQASLDPPATARWLAGGAVTGQVDLVRAGAVIESQTFTVRPAQPAYLSLMGTGSVLLLLFAVAYVEAVLRSVRRGLRPVGGMVSNTGLGLLGGIALWVLLGVLVQAEPNLVAALGSALAGAAAGLFATLATRRLAAARLGRVAAR